jgi:hypothetical protein
VPEVRSELAPLDPGPGPARACHAPFLRAHAPHFRRVAPKFRRGTPFLRRDAPFLRAGAPFFRRVAPFWRVGRRSFGAARRLFGVTRRSLGAMRRFHGAPRCVSGATSCAVPTETRNELRARRTRFPAARLRRSLRSPDRWARATGGAASRHGDRSHPGCSGPGGRPSTHTAPERTPGR